MLATLRARIALICMATVGTALVATCVINYTLVSTYESRTIANDVNSISDGYATSISQWVEARTGSVSGVGAELLDDAALDAVSQLKDGGGFSSAYVGYPNHDVIRRRGQAWVRSDRKALVSTSRQKRECDSDRTVCRCKHGRTCCHICQPDFVSWFGKSSCRRRYQTR